MRTAFVIGLLCTGCNVFYGVGPTSTAPPAPCAPGDRCAVDCDGCEVTCPEESRCDGAVTEATVVCEGDSRCELSCGDGSCVFDCSDRDATCLIECADGATCELDCGNNRWRRAECEFVTCRDATTCRDGRVVCNGNC